MVLEAFGINPRRLTAHAQGNQEILND